MKPLNHKDRNTAISRFVFSFIPVALITVVGIYLYSMTAREHSTFIKHKYEIENKKYSEQALIADDLDKVVRIYSDLLNEDKARNRTENEFQELQRIVSSKIKKSEKRLEEYDSPFKNLLVEAKMIQSVLDSLNTIRRKHVRDARQLKKCQDIYQKKKNT